MPTSPHNLTILGIDPGIASVGYGVISVNGRNKFSLIKAGCLTTSTKDSFPKRLKKIYEDTKKIIREFKPKIIAIEELFFYKNVKTAINVSQARGVVLLAAVQNNLIIREFTPLEIKQAVSGYGRAEKKQVKRMVELILNEKVKITNDNTADALAAAICGGQTKDFKLIK